MRKKKVHFIGAATGWGAQIRKCEEGPEILIQDLKKHHTSILYPKTRFKEQNKIMGMFVGFRAFTICSK